MTNRMIGRFGTPQSWQAGRVLRCPPYDGSGILPARPMPVGAQRSARPTCRGPLKNAALRCLVALLLTASAAPAADSSSVLYQSDFSKVDADQVPNDFLVLDGGFGVKEFDGKKVLELPGAPLDTFGVLFGSSTNSGVSVTAQIYGTSKGRRYPVFGVGLNGVGGYKLKVAPAKGALEIYKGDDILVSVPFEWKSGSWTALRLRVRAEGANGWKIEGKAWPQSTPEPDAWMAVADQKTPPPDGRASIWGSPFSGMPIRFDDLRITRQ
jgi:hypothetical protein